MTVLVINRSCHRVSALCLQPIEGSTHLLKVVTFAIAQIAAVVVLGIGLFEREQAGDEEGKIVQSVHFARIPSCWRILRRQSFGYLNSRLYEDSLDAQRTSQKRTWRDARDELGSIKARDVTDKPASFGYTCALLLVTKRSAAMKTHYARPERRAASVRLACDMLCGVRLAAMRIHQAHQSCRPAA